MRTALAMVFLLLLAGLVQHPQPTELADEITVYSTDNYDPVADMTLGANQAIASNIAHTGTKNVAGQDWDTYRLTLDSTGQLNVEFDASNSSDPDATTGNGIVTYEWKILFDAPYGDTSFNLEGHTFEEPASSNGLFTYSFQNVTVSEDGAQENQIRMELRVYDAVGKVSEKFRMYFVVVPNDWGDDEPVFQIDASDNMTSTDADVFYINGTVVSGSETGEVYVETAFSMDDFDASAVQKYTLAQEGLWTKTNALSDGDSFSLMLSIDGLYTNLSETIHVYIKTYEGDNQRWVTYHWFEITLMACQGLVAPEDAINAGGEFILDGDGDCQWDGAWMYDPLADVWSAPPPGASIELTAPDLLDIIDTDFMLVNGTLLNTTMSPAFVEVAFNETSFDASPVDKYDLRLDGVWNRSDGLEQGDDFSLGLMLDSIQTNVTIIQSVYINAYGYDSNNEAVLLTSLSVMVTVPYLDSDGDGIPDEADAFPFDGSEWLDTDSDGVGDNSDYAPYDPTVWEDVDDTSSECEEWEYWNPDLIDTSLPGNGCPHYEGSNTGDGTGDGNGDEDDDDDDESIPGFEVWLLILALLFAVSFRRKLNV
ncbi:MAG: hypothetical protein ACPHM4_02570 [Candidatus Poseidoniaceae archaeon]